MKPTVASRYASVVPVMRYFYGVAWDTDRPYFLLVIISMFVRGLSPFVNIVIPKYLIDEFVGARRPGLVIQLVVALVLANLVIALVNNLLGYLTNKHRTRIDMRIDEILGYQAMNMDFEYAENPKVLTQLEKARTGVSWYSGGIGGLSENLIGIVSSLITFAGTIYIIGSLSPWLIGILVTLILVTMVLVSRAQRLQAQFMKDLVGINRKFGYYFSLVKTFRYGKDIRMYAADDMIRKRVDKYIDEDWDVEALRIKYSVRYEIIITLLGVAQQAMLYGYLGLRVLAKTIGIGDFQMLLGAAQAFSGSLSGVIRQFIDIAKNADFMMEYKIFVEYPSAKHQGKLKVTERDDHVFEFRDVSFRYPQAAAEAYALRKVSITVPTGQRLSIVGENGAGKTTFIKLLCRLYDPTDGQILLDGVDIREYDIDDYMRTFAVVFQDFRLLAFTVAENVAVSEEVDQERFADAAEKAGFAEKLRTLENGMSTSVYKSFDEKGVEFSGGESQKLAIARAVYKDAPVTILDEPTAALDPVAEYEIYNHFDQLMGGKTALYISHRLSSCRFCNKIAVFHNGEITEYGTHADLAKLGGKYSEMWRAQAQYYENVVDGGRAEAAERAG